MNGERYKEDSESYQKMKKKLVRAFDSQTLIEELKRRKIVHVNWDTLKYDFTPKSRNTKGDKE